MADRTQTIRRIVFPRADIESDLRTWWQDEMTNRNDDPLAERGTLYEVLTEMDSISVVRVLLLVEPRLGGVELPPTLIKRGGYRDCDEMINHLIPALQKFHDSIVSE